MAGFDPLVKTIPKKCLTIVVTMIYATVTSADREFSRRRAIASVTVKVAQHYETLTRG